MKLCTSKFKLFLSQFLARVSPKLLSLFARVSPSVCNNLRRILARAAVSDLDLFEGHMDQMVELEHSWFLLKPESMTCCTFWQIIVLVAAVDSVSPRYDPSRSTGRKTSSICPALFWHRTLWSVISVVKICFCPTLPNHCVKDLYRIA